jgi:DNA-binding NtrC family response regulator
MNAHLLLVEDDEALRAMLVGLLESQGYAVAEAGSREEALARLQKEPDTAAVILDLGLPPRPHETSEGLQTLRDLQSTAHPAKVIVLTGQDEEAAALAAIREGAFDFLAKPAESAAILQAVARASLFALKERELRAAGVARIAINTPLGDGLKTVREDAEERLVRQVLRETGFNVYQSARRLGVKRENIYYFLKKFGIQRKEGE